MAKELPYFKFEPNQWENGNIQICTREDKGLFMDLCSMYWSRLGNLPLKLAVQKLCAGNATAFDSLIEEGIFEVIDDAVRIEFLDEQLNGFEDTSETNRKNALIGWEKRRKQKALSERNATASKPQSESDAIREEKRREEKKKENEKKKGSIPTFEEFEKHAKVKANEIGICIDPVKLKTKYIAWKDAGWKTGKDKKIQNWKSTLTNTLQYLKSEGKTSAEIHDVTKKIRFA